MRRSTWSFLRESGFGLQGIHGYVYTRWTRLYVRALLKLGNTPAPSPAKRWVAKHYHGKVLTHEHARAIITLDRDISTRVSEQIVPFELARDIVLKSPLDIVAFECACRNIRPGHCEPTQVCLIAGKPITDLILENNPQSARLITQAEAADLLAAEHARGHVHTAWFKDAMLNRFYAICNCCKCCCAGIKAMVDFAVPVVASSGYVAEVDAALCANCGDCLDACAFKALSAGEGAVARDWERCMGCGACEVKCAAGAMKLVLDPRKGTPLDVSALA
jgi:NAD-dependent dihydropyrimidine dehydrogenase PreA subunit